MDLDIRNDPAELQAMVTAWSQAQLGLWTWGLAAGLILGADFLGRFVTGWLGYPVEGYFVAFLAGLMAAALAVFVFTRASGRFLKRRLVNSLEMRGRMQLSLSASAVQGRHDLGRFHHDWAAVTDVQARSEGLYLVVYHLECVALPDRSLPEGQSRADLRAAIDGWRGQ